MNINNSLIDSITAIGKESDMASGKDSPFVTESSPNFAYKFTSDVFVVKDRETGKITLWSTDDSDKSKSEKDRILLRMTCAAYFHNIYMTKYSPVEKDEIENMLSSLRQRSLLTVPTAFEEAGKFFLLFNMAASAVQEPGFFQSTPLEVGSLALQMLNSEDTELRDRWNEQVKFGGKTYHDTFQEMYDICVTIGLNDYKACADIRPRTFNINWQPTAQWLESKMEKIRSERFKSGDHENDVCDCTVCSMKRMLEKVEYLTKKIEEKL